MSDPLVEHSIPSNLKAYVCIEVFDRAQPVLLVDRADGDWCFLCGGVHPDDAAYFRVVGIRHPVGDDPTLADVLDLGANEQAERSHVGGEWSRSRITGDG